MILRHHDRTEFFEESKIISSDVTVWSWIIESYVQIECNFIYYVIMIYVFKVWILRSGFWLKFFGDLPKSRFQTFFKTILQSYSMIILIFLLRAFTCTGCNNINRETKQSICFEKWQQSRNLKTALQCCLSNSKGSFNTYDVPVILLPTNCHHSLNKQSHRKRCQPILKCLPRTLKDVEKFFNFLDMLNLIPFVKYQNWKCFNSNDHFKVDFSVKKLKRLHALRPRLNANFCRSILLEYYVQSSLRYLLKDICEDKILPFQRGRGKVRFTVFNPLKQIVRPVCLIDELNQATCSSNVEYLKQKLATPVTIFDNFYAEWREMGISIPDKLIFFCGCFLN